MKKLLILFLFVTLLSTAQNDSIRPIEGYWTIEVIDSGIKTSIMFTDKTDANQLIEKNKADLKSSTGKNNTLIVLEVYDIQGFLGYISYTPQYLNAVLDKWFNPKPFYNSRKK